MKTTEKRHEPLLDIDHLRSFDVKPAYFGLGFIQLKIKRNSRVHFYHDDLPVLAEEPHAHRYGFTSYIMQGRFEQTLYQYSANQPSGEFYMDFEDCKPGSEPTPDMTGGEQNPGTLHELFHAEYQADDYYRIEADTLHTVKGMDNAITYLVRDEPSKDFAGVVRRVGADKVCPFSEPIAVDRCWEMIEDMLPEQKRPGYHLRKIQKGKIGEVSKIIEEANELLDAYEQGIKIMELVELSDLYGAMVRYLEKYHPGMSMKDIKGMHQVTRRAFDNKRR